MEWMTLITGVLPRELQVGDQVVYDKDVYNIVEIYGDQALIAGYNKHKSIPYAKFWVFTANLSPTRPTVQAAIKATQKPIDPKTVEYLNRNCGPRVEQKRGLEKYQLYAIYAVVSLIVLVIVFG